MTTMTPEKIALLHEGEEAIRAEAVARITVAPDLSAHVDMIERCMDLIHTLLPSRNVKDEDQLMLGNLGIRIFNALASALKLLLSGYYQASALQLRDVLETTFLLDYFSTDATLVTRWRTSTERDRKSEFKPVSIRMALDTRDGFTEKKRADAYELLCKLAGHATPEGAIMLVPNRGDTIVHCGPFLEDTAMRAVVSEAAKLALQAAQVFRKVIENETVAQKEARIVFIEAETAWLTQFFGKTD